MRRPWLESAALAKDVGSGMRDAAVGHRGCGTVLLPGVPVLLGQESRAAAAGQV